MLFKSTPTVLKNLLRLPVVMISCFVFAAFAYYQTAFAQTDKSQELDLKDQLTEAVTELLLERAQDYNGSPELHIERFDTKNYSFCDDLDIRIAGTGDLRSVTTLVANCNAPQKWRLYIKANVKIIGDYYVASRLIQRNEPIGPDDIQPRQTDLLRKQKAITRPENIIGWLSNRRIARGSAINRNSLRDPNSIIRGQQVQTVARGVGFIINGTGMAISSGDPGMQIQVRTPNGKVITGTVIDASTVQVLM